MRIYLIGYMGCGKTSIGKPLSKRLSFEFVDMDAVIEQQQGVSVGEIFTRSGEHVFRDLERKVLKNSSEKDNVIVSTGGGVPCFFDSMEFMNAHGVTVYLKMSPEKLAQRLQGGAHKRPLIKDKSPEELIDFIKRNLEERENFYSQAKLIISCDAMSNENISNHIELYIENYLQK